MCDKEKKERYGGGTVGEIARAQGAYFAARAESHGWTACASSVVSLFSVALMMVRSRYQLPAIRPGP